MLQLNYRCCLSFILQSYLGILKLQYHRKLHTYQLTISFALVSMIQARVQEFVRGGGGQNLKAFFFCLFVFCFSIFQGGAYAAHKIAEKMIFSTKK